MILNEKQIIRNQIVSEKNEWLWSSIAKNASTTVTNSIIHNFVDKEIKDTHFYIRNNTKNNKDVSSLSFFEIFGVIKLCITSIPKITNLVYHGMVNANRIKVRI